MRKQKAHLALAASVLCAVQMGYVQAAGQTGMFGTTVPTEYQTDINNYEIAKLMILPPFA